HKILHILMFITSFGEQNITYKCCSNFLIHLYPIMPIKPSSYAKGFSTAHEHPVSKNQPEEQSDTESPSIKTNAEYSYLREAQLNPLKRK
ncbi:amino acid ABC transporter substrate-binding protein, partial [Acinetobacter seifertii]